MRVSGVANDRNAQPVLSQSCPRNSPNMATGELAARDGAGEFDASDWATS